MHNKTELMDNILTSPEAQKIIEFVSPVYGDAYTGLHLFNCIGRVLDELDVFPDHFKDQIFVQTADLWSLDYWEKQYGIVPGQNVSEEERKRNLLEKMGRRFNNPKRIEDVLTSMLGYEVEVKENTDMNTFSVLVKGYVSDLEPAKVFIDRVKPAHLVYEIKVSEIIEAVVHIYYGLYISEHEYYQVQVL